MINLVKKKDRHIDRNDETSAERVALVRLPIEEDSRFAVAFEILNTSMHLLHCRRGTSIDHLWLTSIFHGSPSSGRLVET